MASGALVFSFLGQGAYKAMSSIPEQSGRSGRLSGEERNTFQDSSLKLRRRSVWEAVDSGLLLWRGNFAYFIPFFALPLWIIACGLRLLPRDYIFLSYIVLWWLKPLFDRLLLHVVSFKFFASREAKGFKELLKGLTVKTFRGVMGDLLWRRFSPGRASRMPIRVLERIGGRQYRARRQTLASGGLNFCSMISAMGLAAEAGLLLSEIIFVIMVAEVFSPSALSYLRSNIETMETLIYTAYCFNFFLVESLYVCMGFGLYINSRVEVEGWDLQILFQKFAERRNTLKAILLVVFITARFLGPGLPAAYAEQDEDEEQSVEEAEGPIEYFPDGFLFPDEDAQMRLEEILSSKDFGSEKEGWVIRFKRSPDRDLPDINLEPWMEKLRELFGFILRLFMILAFAAFLGFGIFWFMKYRRKSFRRRGRGGGFYTNPVLPSESPQSLFASAEHFYKQGLLKEAWAACLEGCIGAYSLYCSLSFPSDFTEYGCLQLVREALPGEANDFGELIESWILFSYGGRVPSDAAFGKAITHGLSIADRLNTAEAGEAVLHEP